MDSLTQFVLGATVGEVVLGKKVGNKAIIYGGIGGTIPDLDVLLNNFYDPINALMMHRGFSHSIFFPLIAAPLLGFLIHKWHSEATRKEWAWLFFWTIFTHPLLDIFTGYGTGLLTPLVDYRIQLDTIFIIDPGYTLPLLLTTITVLFFRRTSPVRLKIGWMGLILANLYLLYTVYHKLHFHQIVKANLTKQGISANRFMTAPAPLNNFLWWALIEEEDSYRVGYYSFFDSEPKIEFKPFEKQSALLTPLLPNKEIETLIKFCKGYYIIRESDNQLIFNDLRFGTISGWDDLSKDFIFSFDIEQINGNIYVTRRSATRNPDSEDIRKLIERIKGN